MKQEDKNRYFQSKYDENGRPLDKKYRKKSYRDEKEIDRVLQENKYDGENDEERDYDENKESEIETVEDVDRELDRLNEETNNQIGANSNQNTITILALIFLTLIFINLFGFFLSSNGEKINYLEAMLPFLVIGFIVIIYKLKKK